MLQQDGLFDKMSTTNDISEISEGESEDTSEDKVEESINVDPD